MTYTDIIRQHYKEQAETYGLAPTSTMLDQITRAKECEAIIAIAEHLAAQASRPLDLLDVGCGNGYLLALLAEKLPAASLTGLDFSQEMVDLAASRQVPRCAVLQGDVRELALPGAAYDLVVSERCLVNLLSDEDQAQALRELWRILRPNGRLILLEAFQDGLENLNRAKRELGLEENSAPYHNLWLDKRKLADAIAGRFEMQEAAALAPALPPANFLSSHYFVSRVLYPLVTKAPIVYNSEFVSFFRFLPPMGNYSPIQVFVLARMAEG